MGIERSSQNRFTWGHILNLLLNQRRRWRTWVLHHIQGKRSYEGHDNDLPPAFLACRDWTKYRRPLGDGRPIHIRTTGPKYLYGAGTQIETMSPNRSSLVYIVSQLPQT